MRRIVVGVGARSASTPAAVAAAIDTVLSGLAGPGPDAAAPAEPPGPVLVAALATLDRRAAVAGPVALARGWELTLFPEPALATVNTPHTVRTTGRPSIAEAAALLAAGPGARLLVPKQTFPGVTVAVAAAPARGSTS